MRDRATELGFTIWVSILFLVAAAILVAGTVAINRVWLPAQMGVERTAVQQSKSFVDSTNAALMNLQTEYTRLSAKVDGAQNGDSAAIYRAQQRQIIEQMCAIMTTMANGTVNYSIVDFVNAKGGC